MIKTNCPKVAKNLFILLIVSLVFVISFSKFSSYVYAITSENINFQGKIVRNDTGHEGLNVIPGTPACVVDGVGNDTCDFQVAYYTASTGGTLLLTETFLNVEIGQYDGVFELSLGSGSMTTTAQCRDGTCNTPMEVISEYPNLYVELKFAPDGTNLTETFTRMPLEASPYSIFSKYAEGANDAFKLSTSLSSQTQSSPTTGMVYYNTTDSKMKVYNGTAWENVNLWTDAGTFTYLTSTTDDLVLGASTGGADGIFYFDMNASDGSYFNVNDTSSNRLLTILSGGNVGIGTATPSAKLEVAGSSSTITNASGDLTISTGGLNGNILISPHGTGSVRANSPFGIRETGTTPTFYTYFVGGDQTQDETYTLPTTSSTGFLKNTSGVLSWTGPNWSEIMNVGGVYMDYKPNNTACADGKVLKYTGGTGWLCADDNAGTGGDNWGTQYVEKDSTLVGTGVTGSLLGINLGNANTWTAAQTLRAGALFDTATATDDKIQIIATTGGTNSFTGQLTNSDLTAARTWTLPNATGTLALGTSTANYVAYWSDTNTLTGEATLAISRGGTNASTYTQSQFLWYNGTSIVASGYDQNSFATTSQLYWSRNGTDLNVYPTTSGDDVYLPTNSILGVGYNTTAITGGVAAFNGNVGIGTSTIGATLDVVTTATTGIGANITANSLTSGSGLRVSSTATTGLTGNMVDVSGSLTTGAGSLLAVTANGLNGTGSGLKVTSSTTGALTNGLVYLNTTGNYTSGSVLNIASVSTAGDVVKITNTSAKTAGSVLSVVANSATTVTNGLVNIAGNALTTGSALKVTSTGTTTLTGNLVDLSSSLTTPAGSVLGITANGINGTGSGLKVTSSTTGALTNGLVYVNGSAAHTGSLVNVVTATATGVGLNVTVNSLTSGSGLRVSSTATTGLTGNVADFSGSLTTGTGSIVGITANGINGTGNGLKVTSSTTGVLTNGLAYINVTGAASGTVAQIGLNNTTGAASASVLTLTNSYASNTGTTLLVNHYATGTGNLVMRVNDESGDTTPFVIDGGGNVGIGTASPTQLLDVNGAMRLRGQLYDYSNSVGTPGQVLSTTANGVSWVSVLSNPMSAAGDLIYGGTSGAATRLPGSSNDGYVLKYSTSGATPYWAADIDTDTDTDDQTWDEIGNPGANKTFSMGGYITSFEFNSVTAGEAFSLSSSSLTSGKVLSVSSSSTAFTGALAQIGLFGDNAANMGTLLVLSNEGLNNTGTTFFINHMATGTGNLAMRVDDEGTDTTPFVINGVGSVGIGDSAPSNKLVVNNDISTTTTMNYN